MDGAYETKIERLKANNAPHLLLLHYDKAERQVQNLRVVPRFFFTAEIIQRRKPLGPHARRAGWVGSNILLNRIPISGQIPIIQDGVVRDLGEVRRAWESFRFLEQKRSAAKGWLLDVMRCVELLGSGEFSLSDVYAFEDALSALYPGNNNVRPKIRQQLQVLRDNDFLEFLGRGRYRRLGRRIR